MTEQRPIGRKVSSATRRKQNSLEDQAKNAVYETKKDEILKNDKKNRKKIVMLQTADGQWWKMFDRSAAIYAYHLAPLVGKTKVKFLEDTDPRLKAEHGVVTVKNIAEFEASMVRLGVAKIFDKDGMKVFEMKKALSNEEVEEFLGMEQELRKKANRLIVPEVVLPDLYFEVMELAKTTVNTVQQIERSVRSAYGKDLLEKSQEISRNFVLMSNGWKDPEDYFERALYALNDMQADMMPISHARLTNVGKVFQMMRQIDVTRKQLLKDAKEYTKRKEAQNVKNREKKSEKGA